MLDYDLTRAEQVRRTDLAQKARRMILSHMKVEAQDETSLTLDHRGYYMQISFSPLHPLLVVCLAKAIRNPDGARKQQLANEQPAQRVGQPRHQRGRRLLFLSRYPLAGYGAHAGTVL